MSQIYFRLSCLETTFHCLLHPLLILSSVNTLQEKIRITPEIFFRWEPNCIDSFLDDNLTGGWKLCYAASK